MCQPTERLGCSPRSQLHGAAQLHLGIEPSACQNNTESPLTRARCAAFCWSVALAAAAGTASAPRPGARLAAAALACDDPATPRDSSPIYELGAAETSATSVPGNELPSLGGPGRLVTV